MEDKIYQIPVPLYDFKTSIDDIIPPPIYRVDDNPENFYNYEENKNRLLDPFFGSIQLKHNLRTDFALGKDVSGDEYKDVPEDPRGENYLIRYIFDLNEIEPIVNKVIRNEEEDRFIFSIDNINKKYFGGYIKGTRMDVMINFTDDDIDNKINCINYDKDKNALILCILSKDNKPLYNDIMNIFRNAILHNYVFPWVLFKPMETFKKFVYYFIKYNLRYKMTGEDYKEAWDNLRKWAEAERKYYKKAEVCSSIESIYGEHHFEKLLNMMKLLESKASKGDSDEKG